MISGKFAITVHILNLLSEHPEEYLTSDYIANSVNLNPVLIRKEIANLKKNNLVESKEGKNGGTKLVINPTQITLDTIFKITLEKHSLGYSKNEPNPKCEVGKQINKKLDILYADLNDKINLQLGSITLQNFSNMR